MAENTPPTPCDFPDLRAQPAAAQHAGNALEQELEAARRRIEVVEAELAAAREEVKRLQIEKKELKTKCLEECSGLRAELAGALKSNREIADAINQLRAQIGG